MPRLIRFLGEFGERCDTAIGGRGIEREAIVSARRGMRRSCGGSVARAGCAGQPVRAVRTPPPFAVT
jgi:hypothetical protein